MGRFAPKGKSPMARAQLQMRPNRKVIKDNKSFDGERRYIKVHHNTWIDVTDKTKKEIVDIKKKYEDLLDADNLKTILQQANGTEIRQMYD